MIKYDKKLKTYYNKNEQGYGGKSDDLVAVKLPSLPKKTTIDNVKTSIVKNFNCGDLMYGLSTWRDSLYLKKLEDFHKNNAFNITSTNNNLWARRGTRNTRSMIINSYSDPLRSALSNEFDRIRKGHYEFNYSVLSKAIEMAKIGRPERFGFDFKNYGDIAAKHKKLKISSKHVDEWLWWKRGSKNGIEMIAQQSSDSKRRLHFILDGLNIQGVINKDNNCYGLTITASELRYIYRNWSRLSDKVLFYLNGEVVKSPWENSNIFNN